jgi:hypothetical protein
MKVEGVGGGGRGGGGLVSFIQTVSIVPPTKLQTLFHFFAIHFHVRVGN